MMDLLNFMDRDDWKPLIAAGEASPPKVIEAAIFQKVYGTDSLPMLVTASDGEDYVVKAPWSRPSAWKLNDPKAHDGGNVGSFMKAVMVNEQVVGRVAQAMSAPTPGVALVSISQEFLNANLGEIREQVRVHGYPAHSTFAYMEGVAHGSRFITKLGERQGFDFIDAYPANRERMAKLAVFYGLVGIPGDFQCFYDDATRLVYSVDHGFAFGGYPFWGALSSSIPAPGPCAVVVGGQGLSAVEIAKASVDVDALSASEVALSVSSPPEAWNIDTRRRTRAAMYLWSRKGSFPGPEDRG